MRKIYLLCLSCIVGIIGVRYYFELTGFNGAFLKLYGLLCLMIAVLLVTSFFTDLPQKIRNKLVIGNLLILVFIQFIPISTIFYELTLSLELLGPFLIVLLELLGMIYIGIKMIINYFSMRKAKLKMK